MTTDTHAHAPPPTGSAYEISWHYRVDDEVMTLILYRGGRQTLVIADVKEGISSYKWTVPDHLDTRDDYTVQMVSESHAEESGEFSISNPNGDSTDDGIIVNTEKEEGAVEELAGSGGRL